VDRKTDNPPLPDKSVVVQGVQQMVPRTMDDVLPVGYNPGRHYIAFCCKEAKAQFGLPKRNEANYIMVRRFVRDRMVARGLRPQHIAEHLPKVVAYVFIPSESEIFARDMLMSNIVLDRTERYTSRYYTSEGDSIPDPFNFD